MHSKVEKYKAAVACFGFNKNQDTCFVTGDLECFSNRNLAVNHARNLDDKTIEVFERDGEAVTNNTDEANKLSSAASLKPDSKLANEQANGENLNKQFASVKPGGNAPKAKVAPKPAAAPKAKAAPKPAVVTEQKGDEKGANA